MFKKTKLFERLKLSSSGYWLLNASLQSRKAHLAKRRYFLKLERLNR